MEQYGQQPRGDSFPFTITGPVAEQMIELTAGYATEVEIDYEECVVKVWHPALPGCAAQGETIMSALGGLAQQRLGWTERAAAEGRSVPPPPDFPE
jgi:hypothetical protein